MDKIRNGITTAIAGDHSRLGDPSCRAPSNTAVTLGGEQTGQGSSMFHPQWTQPGHHPGGCCVPATGLCPE